ncbi:MAG: putative endoplasmic reticulum-Golgi intermediate compartment protein 3 [Streblomastix strix]|uniref:Putative endoplasmic reticulum-Golgi intermediate compartment protein 3 n=1 Tax=Streblomastix strix TaxID=222440 RepID=A0A5J4V3G8_9EUKA|nr:MAG: putative endoplasmic reticulum-Golgi intermediate compartment protein 3 [Streblomastix strix]
MRRLDLYGKRNDTDFQQVHTNTGMIISLITLLLCSSLFIIETYIWANGDILNEVVVDTDDEKSFPINFDVSFPHVECKFLAIDLLDKNGNRAANVVHNIHKHNINKEGKETSSIKLKSFISVEEHIQHEKQAEQRKTMKSKQKGECNSCGEADEILKGEMCCNTCDDLIAAYKKAQLDFENVLFNPLCDKMTFNEIFLSKDRGGCNIHGIINASRVQGQLNIGLVNGFMIDMTLLQEFGVEGALNKSINITHTIKRLSFGKEYKQKDKSLMENTLDGFNNVQDSNPLQSNYFVKIVPSTYISSGSLNEYTLKQKKEEKQRKLKLKQEREKLEEEELKEKILKEEQEGKQSGKSEKEIEKLVKKWKKFNLNKFWKGKENESFNSNRALILGKEREEEIMKKGFNTYQYSASYYNRPFIQQSRKGIGLYIYFDLTPMRVVTTERKQSFFHYVTNLSALLGGIFAIMGFLDSGVFGAQLKKQKQLLYG